MMLGHHGSRTSSGKPRAIPILPILRGVRRSITTPQTPISTAGMIKDGSNAINATSTTPAPQPPRQASGVCTRRSTRARAAWISSGSPMATMLSDSRP
jgi:hypothetical protein